QEAVSAALAQAAGGAAEETAEAAEEETTEAAAEETTEAAEAETAAAEEAAAAGAYTPGTYEASAQGFQGEVKVAVTVGDNGKITSVQILDYSTETPEVGQAAAVKLSGAIVKAQSADVDVVSGASLTSTAVIEAVKAALAEAAN
ncbi:MAG: TonB family protein, partial [Eubacteriales bacterium]|nr:TonB family protein [Eubacteriales bacterium]